MARWRAGRRIGGGAGGTQLSAVDVNAPYVRHSTSNRQAPSSSGNGSDGTGQDAIDEETSLILVDFPLNQRWRKRFLDWMEKAELDKQMDTDDTASTLSCSAKIASALEHYKAQMLEELIQRKPVEEIASGLTTTVQGNIKQIVATTFYAENCARWSADGSPIPPLVIDVLKSDQLQMGSLHRAYTVNPTSAAKKELRGVISSHLDSLRGSVKKNMRQGILDGTSTADIMRQCIQHWHVTPSSKLLAKFVLLRRAAMNFPLFDTIQYDGGVTKYPFKAGFFESFDATISDVNEKLADPAKADDMNGRLEAWVLEDANAHGEDQDSDVI